MYPRCGEGKGTAAKKESKEVERPGGGGGRSDGQRAATRAGLKVIFMRGLRSRSKTESTRCEHASFSALDSTK